MLQHLRRRLASRIRYKIILPYLFLAAALLGLLTAVTFWLYANNLQKQLDQSLRTSATNTSLGLETLEAQLLDNLRPVVSGAANVTESISSTVDAFADRDVDQIQKIVDIAFGYYKPSRILALDTAGVVMVDTAQPKVREHSPPLVGSDQLARDALIQAVLTGEVDQYGDKYASLLRFGTDPPYTMFFVIAPVKVTGKGGGDRIVGAMVYAEPLDGIVQNQLPLRNNAPITAILGGDGAVLASNPPNQSDNDLVLSAAQIQQLKDIQKTADAEKNASLFTTIKRGEINFQVLYSPLRIRRNLDGYFAVALPRSAIDSAWQQTRLAVGLFAIMALGMVVLVGTQVTRSITKPLGELVETALQVKRGDLESRTFVSGSNELGTLASVLNDMTDRLLDLYRTSRQLGGELSIGGVLSQTNHAIQRLLPAANATALVLDGDLWRHHTADGEREVSTPLAATTLDILPGVVDLHDDTLIKPVIDHLTPNAQVALTLRSGQRSIGILTIANGTERIDLHALGEPLSAIASMTASAMQNALLYSTVQAEAVRKQAILQSIADGVVVLDSERRVLLVNHTAGIMLGAESEGLVGHPWADLQLTPIHGAGDLFGGQHTTTLYESVDGSRVLSVSAAPITSDGHNNGEVLVLHDVTAERAMDRAKTDFIATISHELRTPLTSICGYADLMLRGFAGALNEEQLEFMQTIRQQGQTMVDVLQNVIIIASIEAGTMTAMPQPYQVQALVDQAISATRKSIEAKQLELVIDIQPDLPYILVDRDHFKIILMQLLDNARRYTQQGSITVRASKRDDRVFLDVIDTGRGIAAEDQPRLFNRFQRGGEQSGLTSKERGVGLGLAIAKQLVEAFGGRIEVQSEINVGSTFSIEIPAVSEEQLHSNEYGVAAAA